MLLHHISGIRIIQVHNGLFSTILMPFTVCPGSSDPFYIASYYIKWVTTSWTYCISLGFWSLIVRVPLPSVPASALPAPLRHALRLAAGQRVRHSGQPAYAGQKSQVLHVYEALSKPCPLFHNAQYTQYIKMDKTFWTCSISSAVNFLIRGLF